MKNIIYIILITVICMFISCNTHRDINENIYGVNVLRVYTMKIDTFSIILIDSMVTADNLPKFENWKGTHFKDGSTGVVNKFSTLYDSETGIVYTVKEDNGRYIVMKRQTN